MNITKILTSNNEFFNTSDIVISFIRWIVFLLIKGIAWIANICQEFYQQCFKFLDFTTYGPVKSFLNEFKGAIVVVLAVSIFIIGYMYMFNKEKKSSFLTNFMIGIFVICSSATLLTSINRLMIQSNKYITSTYSNGGNASASVISSNLTDLIYVDKKVGLANMKKSKIPRANLSDEAIASLDFNEIVKPDSDKLTTSKAKDILKKKLVYIPKSNGSTGYELEDVKDGLLWTDLFSEYYYRYHLNYFTVTLTLLSLAIVFLVMGYKVIRLIWELITSYFLAYIFSGEIASGQATKRIIEFVKNVYIVLLYTMVSIKLYLLAVDYVNRVFSANLRGIVLLCLALAVIDGPVVIEKILGIDAGLQSGVGKLIATTHMIGGATRFAQTMRYQNRANKQLQNLANAYQNNQQSMGERGASGAGSNFSDAFNQNNRDEQSQRNNNFSNENNSFANANREGAGAFEGSNNFGNGTYGAYGSEEQFANDGAFPENNVSNENLEQSMAGDESNSANYGGAQEMNENMSEDYNSRNADLQNNLSGTFNSEANRNDLSSMDQFVSEQSMENGFSECSSEGYIGEGETGSGGYTAEEAFASDMGATGDGATSIGSDIGVETGSGSYTTEEAFASDMGATSDGATSIGSDIGVETGSGSYTTEEAFASDMGATSDGAAPIGSDIGVETGSGSYTTEEAFASDIGITSEGMNPKGKEVGAGMEKFSTEEVFSSNMGNVTNRNDLEKEHLSSGRAKEIGATVSGESRHTQIQSYRGSEQQKQRAASLNPSKENLNANVNADLRKTEQKSSGKKNRSKQEASRKVINKVSRDELNNTHKK